MRKFLISIGILLCSTFFLKAQSNDPYRYMHRMGISTVKTIPAPNRPIIIAIVDDGFNLSHRLLKDYWYRNPLEIENNRFDDDGNGWTDDICGWDFSDNDNDVSIAKGREPFFYHGSYLAGIIASVLKKSFGEEAPKRFRLLPIKVLSDDDHIGIVMDGYKCLDYLLKIKPDIVCMAWGGGTCSREDQLKIEQLIANGTIILASAGNSYSKEPQPPASLPGVIAIAAVDSSLKKLPQSNYGDIIDFVAMGQDIPGGHSEVDSLMLVGGNTSASVGIVTGIVSVIKASFPSKKNIQLIEALKNTSLPVNKQNTQYEGRLGAGLPQQDKAISYLRGDYRIDRIVNTEGYLSFPAIQAHNTYIIAPQGGYDGIWFTVRNKLRKKNKANLAFYSETDSLIASYPAYDLPAKWMIPSYPLKVKIEGKISKKEELLLEYETGNIDSTEIFCKGIVYLKQEEGVINNGSSEENYANNSSCKWLITVPEGMRIQLDFTRMDTQANIDWVQIFDGTETLQERWLAKFSGSNLPPTITSLTNQLLIWFVTDNSVVGKGWEVRYKAVKK